jgi:hypothetical protein
MKAYSYANANVTEWLVETVRRKPEALLLMAAGCALLMRTGQGVVARGSDQPGTIRQNEPSGLGENVQQASDKVSRTARDASRSMSDYAGEIRDRVSDVAGSYANAAADYSAQAGWSLSSKSERISKQAQSAVQTASQNLREQPLLVAALGLLSGAAVASLLPPTQIEQRTFGEARQTVVEAASKVGENVTQAAEETVQQLKDDAANRGMTPEGLKQMAGEAAERFSTVVAGRREEGREASQGSTARDVRQ